MKLNSEELSKMMHYWMKECESNANHHNYDCEECPYREVCKYTEEKIYSLIQENKSTSTIKKEA